MYKLLWLTSVTWEPLMHPIVAVHHSNVCWVWTHFVNCKTLIYRGVYVKNSYYSQYKRPLQQYAHFTEVTTSIDLRKKTTYWWIPSDFVWFCWYFYLGFPGHLIIRWFHHAVSMKPFAVLSLMYGTSFQWYIMTKRDTPNLL